MTDKELERDLLEQSRELFNKTTLPGLYFSQNMGNMYTPSLYYSLFSFLSRYAMTFVLCSPFHSDFV